MEKGAQRYTIFGPPGTGKSTEIIKRFKEYLDQGYHKDRIGLVSFTKASAQELAERIGVKAGKNISTIHSMCYRICEVIREQVIGWQHLREFSKVVKMEFSGANPDDSEELTEGDVYLSLHGLAVATREAYREVYMRSDRVGSMAQFLWFCESYDDWKRESGYVDFGDMLVDALQKPAPDFDVLFVDEAQDLSRLQWMVINHWCQDIPIVHVAGDDDQAIYVWGGADPTGMSTWETLHKAERQVLGQSWRIPKSVHGLAQSVIHMVSERVEKPYVSRPEEGKLEYINNEWALQAEHGEDVLVLYRSHCLREGIEDVLIARNIPYTVDNGKAGILNGKLAKAIAQYFKLVENIDKTGMPMMTDRDLRMLAKNMKYTYKLAVEKEDWTRLGGEWYDVLQGDEHEYNYLKAVYSTHGMRVRPTIHLSSIHGSKGREADHVILLNGVTERTSGNMAMSQANYDAEMRTFYVGVTRARHKLTIVEGPNPLREIRNTWR
ncbi:helicase [Acinetobacter phage SH-Ab 15497]|nr:helicase [Acinetobacter phage SH-Ab 15497]